MTNGEDNPRYVITNLSLAPKELHAFYVARGESENDLKNLKRIEKSKKLLKLRVSTGDGERTLVAGIATSYTPEQLVGRKVVIVANLQPATLMGVQSNGMVLAAEIAGEASLLMVDDSVPVGAKVK